MTDDGSSSTKRLFAALRFSDMALTLEEIFIYELGGTGYDVKNLVL